MRRVSVLLEQVNSARRELADCQIKKQHATRGIGRVRFGAQSCAYGDLGHSTRTY